MEKLLLPTWLYLLIRGKSCLYETLNQAFHCHLCLLSLHTILPKSHIAQTREGGCHLRSVETIALRDSQGFKDNLSRSH